MEKNKMVNYGNGKIYKLVNNCDDKIYIGSTCTTLARRKGQHKSKSKTLINRTVYRHLNQIGWDNVQIILIEVYECKNRDELHRRERYWIDELKPELNRLRPIITTEERKEYDKEYNKKYKKQYYEKNKEQIKEQTKQYRENNKEKIKEIERKYYQENKEEIGRAHV